MEGKTCVVTGANSGIGRVTARALAEQGARVVLVCRSEERGVEARDAIREETGNAQVELVLGDLAEQAGVRHVAAELLSCCPRIDVLVNNAGAYFAEHTFTSDGLERTFALNHMGYFLLTSLLQDRIVASAPARIVNVASAAHWGAALDFDDLQWERRSYSGIRAYCTSKLMNILYTQQLAERLDGTGVTANSVHPGSIRTGFAVKEASWFGALVRYGGFVLLSPESGAKTSIYLASSSDVEGVTGRYFARKKPAFSSSKARSTDLAAQLWQVSESLLHPVDSAQ